MIAATNLIGAMIGANPVKEDGDTDYLKNQRSVAWMDSVITKLTVAEYIGGGVKVDDDPDAANSGTGGAIAANNGVDVAKE